MTHTYFQPTLINLMVHPKSAFSSNYSAQRLCFFHTDLGLDEDAHAGMNNRTNLQSLCEIRWSSRTNALCTFKFACIAVITSLEYLEEDGTVKPDATCCPSDMLTSS